MIDPDHNYRVSIQLNTTDIYDIDARVNEIRDLKDWVDQLVEWQPNQYSFNMIYAVSILDVWFKEEKHAVMCILRWT